jgi:hypothetical protein
LVVGFRRTLPFILISGFLLAACAGGPSQSSVKSGSLKLAPVSALPMEMQNAPTTVRTAYQFAVANPDALRNVPCYCGCGAIGHKSNLACYVKEFDDSGKPVFDSHAMGCSLCVDIAQDVMKMTGEGKQPAEIRPQILAAFSKFGPPNQ